ncbi:hypothetical protein PVAP13_2NG109400 [Panicum virgatum]|uniref:Uncharacterized protein n=1 Tax=Panicum virgatum TaxID=38727 RepID=A0A8T0VCN7_PANVG|nr:hypothetical protein PVAP13_2NG109400 [Panicum virgatum]
MRSTPVRRRPLLDLAPHGVVPLGCSPRRRDPKQRLRRLGAELPLSLSIATSFLGETTYKRWIEVGSMGENSHQLTPTV